MAFRADVSAAWLVGLYLLASAVVKWHGFDDFVVAVTAYDLLHPDFSIPIAALAIGMELAIGSLLLLAPVPRKNRLIAGTLITTFLLAQMATVARGSTGIDCGCGLGNQEVGLMSMSKLVLVLALLFPTEGVRLAKRIRHSRFRAARVPCGPRVHAILAAAASAAVLLSPSRHSFGQDAVPTQDPIETATTTSYKTLVHWIRETTQLSEDEAAAISPSLAPFVLDVRACRHDWLASFYLLRAALDGDLPASAEQAWLDTQRVLHLDDSQATGFRHVLTVWTLDEIWPVFPRADALGQLPRSLPDACLQPEGPLWTLYSGRAARSIAWLELMIRAAAGGREISESELIRLAEAEADAILLFAASSSQTTRAISKTIARIMPRDGIPDRQQIVNFLAKQLREVSLEPAKSLGWRIEAAEGERARNSRRPPPTPLTPADPVWHMRHTFIPDPMRASLFRIDDSYGGWTDVTTRALEREITQYEDAYAAAIRDTLGDIATERIGRGVEWSPGGQGLTSRLSDHSVRQKFSSRLPKLLRNLKSLDDQLIRSISGLLAECEACDFREADLEMLRAVRELDSLLMGPGTREKLKLGQSFLPFGRGHRLNTLRLLVQALGLQASADRIPIPLRDALIEAARSERSARIDFYCIAMETAYRFHRELYLTMEMDREESLARRTAQAHHYEREVRAERRLASRRAETARIRQWIIRDLHETGVLSDSDVLRFRSFAQRAAWDHILWDFDEGDLVVQNAIRDRASAAQRHVADLRRVEQEVIGLSERWMETYWGRIRGESEIEDRILDLIQNGLARRESLLLRLAGEPLGTRE